MTHPENQKKTFAKWDSGESPFLPKNIVKLLTRPGDFFTSELALEKPKYFLLAIWIFGLAFYIENTFWEDTEAFYNSLVQSFPIEEKLVDEFIWN